MMNMTRREPFMIVVSFDCDVSALLDFTLSITQGGQTVCSKGMPDAVIGEDGRSASIMLTGEETAKFHPTDPAYVQARAVLADGEYLHSGAEEINIVDVLDA